MVGSIAKVAEQGMNYNLSKIAKNAHKISKYNTGLEDDGDLITPTVENMVSQKHFEANAKMINTSDEMLETILSMK